MRLAAELHYDAAPAEVFAMLLTQAFQEEKLAATGALSYEVTISPGADGGAVVRSRRELPTDRVPSQFRSLVGPRLAVVQTETWGPAGPTGERTGTLTVEVAHAPLKAAGSLRLLASAGGGTDELVDGELTASIPIVGGRVERALEPVFRAAIDVEARTGKAWLAR